MTATYQELLRAAITRQHEDAAERAAARRRITASSEFQDLVQGVPLATPEAVESLVTTLVTLEVDEGRLRGGDPPARECNGGPKALTWCGAPATLVARAQDGLEWFCCGLHTEGNATTPLAAWFGGGT
jgi:hypothetical protein